MNIKRLLKKYNRVRQKAIKIHQKIESAYAEAYLSNDITSCKEYLNELYAIPNEPKEIIYSDTDSIIIQDFFKKQEV